MQRRRTATRLGVLGMLTAVVLVSSGCGGESIELPSASDLPAPTFVTRPDDLADSPQLDALVPRETAGLGADAQPADGSVLPDALALLATIENPPTMLTAVSIYGESLTFRFYENGVVGRSVYASYGVGYPHTPETPPTISIGEPRFADDPQFPISTIDPQVPAEVVRAVGDRLPLAVVASINLEPSRSYGFGLVWTFGIDDARGSFATVYADLDGSIVGVEVG